MEQILTENNPEKIFKSMLPKKPLKVITPEDIIERRKRACINYLNKLNGIIVEKPTIEEIKQKRLETKRQFQALHRTEYNEYMNNYMKERYKNNEEYRLKIQTRARLRADKHRQNKLLESQEIINVM